MGAAGSTAASCSSLDVGRQTRSAERSYNLRPQKQPSRYQLKNSKQHKTAATKLHLSASGDRLRHSSSYFDLRAAGSGSPMFDMRATIDDDDDDDDDDTDERRRYFGLDSAGAAEVYSLSNASFNVSRPIMVASPAPLNLVGGGGVYQHQHSSQMCQQQKVSSAARGKIAASGVAARIHNGNHSAAFCRLKKLSGSLPSLSEPPLPSQHQQRHHFHHRQPPTRDSLEMVSRSSANAYYQGRPQSGAGQPAASSDQPPQQQPSHRFSNSRVINLVSGGRRDSPPGSAGCQAWSKRPQQQQQRQRPQWQPVVAVMKRAVSLSSFHEANAIANQRQQQQQRQLQQSNELRQRPNSQRRQLMHMLAAHNKIDAKRAPAVAANIAQQANHQHRQAQSIRNNNNSSSDNYPSAAAAAAAAAATACDLGAGQCWPSPGSQKETPLAKKILKFRQVASGAANKRRRQQQQQQHNNTNDNIANVGKQQGCPVLPALPRSHSLHELIQLRATENGQRMRNTGTLRGQLANEPTKVNLVAEMLANKRREKQTEEATTTTTTTTTVIAAAETNANTTSTIESRDDSLDDGIVVSCCGDQSSSTGDSRNSAHDHRAQSSGGGAASTGQAPVKQRMFRKNTGNSQSSSNSNSNSRSHSQQKRFSQQQMSELTASQPKAEPPAAATVGGMETAAAAAAAANRTTLRRTMSHSALDFGLGQAAAAAAADLDADESDDLNELAKFLYQFKQRNAKLKSAPAASDTNEPQQPPLLERAPKEMVKPAAGGCIQVGNESRIMKKQPTQQSPNSTSSTSSGFASSSFNCSSSRSSSSSSSCSPEIEEETRRQRRKSPKKYPAPPRPNEQPAAAAAAAATKLSGPTSLICGQLKLSSSLLSIVDEYNSTLEAAAASSSQPAAHRLAAATSGGGGGGGGLVVGQTFSKASRCESHQQQQQQQHQIELQQQQLEQLKRLTQLRKLSQSELALNQLSSARSLERQFGNSPSSSSSSSSSNERKAAAKGSKLLNLIRRISDRGSAPAEAGPEQRAANHCGHQPSNGPTGSAAAASKPSIIINHRDSGGCCSAAAAAAAAAAAGGCKSGGQQPAMQVPNDAAKPKLPNCGSKSRFEPAAAAAAAACESGRLLSRADRYSNLSRSMANLGAGESVCDLNFDCDLELIKKCAIQKRQQQQQQQVNSIEQTTGSGGGSSNWRLAGGGQLIGNQLAQQRQKQKPTSGGGSASGAGAGRSQASSKSKLSSKIYAQAGGWLMRRKNSTTSSSSSSRISQKRNSPSGHRIEAAAAAAAAASCSKPPAESFGSPLNGEANQLLADFELTLELERQRGANCAPSAAIDCSRSNKQQQQQRRQQHSSATFDTSSSEGEDEFEAHYATISRAMLSATLGSGDANDHDHDDDHDDGLPNSNSNACNGSQPAAAAPGAGRKRADSPSESFTFSAPSSPAASERRRRHSQQQQQQQQHGRGQLLCAGETRAHGDSCDNDPKQQQLQPQQANALEQKQGATGQVIQGQATGEKQGRCTAAPAPDAGRLGGACGANGSCELACRRPSAASPSGGAGAGRCKLEPTENGSPGIGNIPSGDKLITRREMDSAAASPFRAACRQCANCLPDGGGGAAGSETTAAAVSHHFAPQKHLNGSNCCCCLRCEPSLGIVGGGGGCGGCSGHSGGCCLPGCAHSGGHSSSAANGRPGGQAEPRGCGHLSSGEQRKLGHQQQQAGAIDPPAGACCGPAQQAAAGPKRVGRSNSELESGAAAISRQQQQQQQKQLAKQRPLFGKLRDSLLSSSSSSSSSNRRHQQQRPGGKLQSAVSQLSLVHYNYVAAAPPLLVMPPMCAKQKLLGRSGKLLAPAPPRDDPYDDNFILRRKTPSAGLRTRC